MSSDLDSIIRLGNDIVAYKYYVLATGAVLLYDHLLTLADEVKYVWSERKSWIFWLFVVNRYLPVAWQFWQIIVFFAPRSRIVTETCEKSWFYGLVVLVTCTLLAQVIITVRIYAVTTKNIPITIAFATITVTQCTLGICGTILTTRKGVESQPSVPLDAYRLCEFFKRNRRMELAYTSLSLLYDFLAFSLIILLTRKSRVPGLNFSSILDAVAEDATRYFLVIFTSHLVLVVALIFGRPIIQILPSAGVTAYIPIMVSRIMFSLRRAADLLQNSCTLQEQSTNGNTSRHIVQAVSSRPMEDITVPLGAAHEL